jgi:hypothetical protein
MTRRANNAKSKIRSGVELYSPSKRIGAVVADKPGFVPREMLLSLVPSPLRRSVSCACTDSSKSSFELSLRPGFASSQFATWPRTACLRAGIDRISGTCRRRGAARFGDGPDQLHTDRIHLEVTRDGRARRRCEICARERNYADSMTPTFICWTSGLRCRSVRTTRRRRCQVAGRGSETIGHDSPRRLGVSGKVEGSGDSYSSIVVGILMIVASGRANVLPSVLEVRRDNEQARVLLADGELVDAALRGRVEPPVEHNDLHETVARH